MTPGWILYLLEYANFFSILLLVGGVLCFISYGLDTSDPSNLYLGVVLFLVVVISSTFSFLQGRASRKVMEGFRNMVPKKCKVLRGGAAAVLDSWELVPGDVVEFQVGNGQGQFHMCAHLSHHPLSVQKSLV